VQAAWLHHRFTQIHPFADGNGQVARAIASLVFIEAGWFPLILKRDELDRVY
jgi:Fic family protein